MMTLPFVALESLTREELYGLVYVTDEAFTRWLSTLKEVEAKVEGTPMAYGAYLSAMDTALLSASDAQLDALKLRGTDLRFVQSDHSAAALAAMGAGGAVGPPGSASAAGPAPPTAGLLGALTLGMLEGSNGKLLPMANTRRLTDLRQHGRRQRASSQPSHLQAQIASVRLTSCRRPPHQA